MDNYQKRKMPHSQDSELTEYPATRRKLDMALGTVPNYLDDATHRRMDASALETCGEESFSPIFLLATIVSTSEGLLDAKYEKNPSAKSLLREHSGLEALLRIAWEMKSFKSIRNLRKGIFLFTGNIFMIYEKKFCRPRPNVYQPPIILRLMT